MPKHPRRSVPTWEHWTKTSREIVIRSPIKIHRTAKLFALQQTCRSPALQVRDGRGSRARNAGRGLRHGFSQRYGCDTLPVTDLGTSGSSEGPLSIATGAATPALAVLSHLEGALAILSQIRGDTWSRFGKSFTTAAFGNARI